MTWQGFKTLLKREIIRFWVVPSQTWAPPVISSVLFMVIFGLFLGGKVGQVNGFPYLAFFTPGLIILNVITSAYSNSAFSFFLMRFMGHIKDLLVTPLSYAEMVMALVMGSVIRGLLTAVLIYIAAWLLVLYVHGTALPLFNPILALVVLFFTSFIFACIGLLVALLAEEFEHIEILTVFLITPLTFLGGVFNSVKDTPGIVQTVTYFNPFFYIVDAFRYSLLGYSEGNILISLLLLVGLSAALYWTNMELFKKGWKLRT